MAFSYILRDLGTSFATRGRGRELREEVLARAGRETVVVDFRGVTNVSYSFADEFVGKLSADGIELELVNMTEAVQRSVRRAVERRTVSPIGC